MFDKELINEVTLRDNEAAFKVIFDNFYPVLFLFSKRFIQDQELRHDIVQEVFISIWEQRKTLNIKISLQNYLIACCRNACLNYLQRYSKRNNNEESLSENLPIYCESVEDIFSVGELVQLLENALAKLPDNYRQVYEMSRFESKKNREIADSLGVSEKTVERYKRKVEAFLRIELKEYLPLLFLFP